jgi:hypothetical protein
MELTNPLDIFNEAFSQQEMEAARQNAVEAVRITQTDGVEEGFNALPPMEQDMLMAKLIKAYDPEKIKMFCSWATRYN